MRLVEPHDEPEFYRLSQECDRIGWQHSGSAFLQPHLYGLFTGGRLLALAHYVLWAANAASIGVVTHPAHRGQGYGKAVVSAAMQDAFAQGHIVIYQTLCDNMRSIALAKRLGCQEYAHTFKIYYGGSNV